MTYCPICSDEVDKLREEIARLKGKLEQVEALAADGQTRGAIHALYALLRIEEVLQ